MSNGKGMKPKVGYNYKNWNDNYDLIDWNNKNKQKEKTNERNDRRTEEVSGSNGQ